MSIKELVIKAIKERGGKARFNEIYEIVRRERPDAKAQSIRFLLYHETVGPDPTFVKLKPGLYGLQPKRHEIQK